MDVQLNDLHLPEGQLSEPEPFDPGRYDPAVTKAKPVTIAAEDASERGQTASAARMLRPTSERSPSS